MVQLYGGVAGGTATPSGKARPHIPMVWYYHGVLAGVQRILPVLSTVRSGTASTVAVRRYGMQIMCRCSQQHLRYVLA